MSMKADVDSAKDDLDEDAKKLDEPMPVEEDSILETVDKVDEILTEADVDVHSINENDGIGSECIVKSEEISSDTELLDKSDESSTATMGLAEPMECASVNSQASPKHAMATDESMLESVSVWIDFLVFYVDLDT